ncbi:MAG: DUF1552 domain-containing protein [Myxococcota bacterium]
MTISRRKLGTILGGTLLGGGAILGAPALRGPTLRGLRNKAKAQPPAGPVRFLGVRTPHGVDRDWWIPKQSNGADPQGEDMALSDLTFEYENAVLTPLMGWRDQITILDGLDTQVTKEGTRGGTRTSHGHNEQGTLLNGAQPPSDREGNFGAGHPSLDFYMHGRLSPDRRLITASVAGTGSWKCMSYDDNGRPRSPESRPQSVYDEVFQGFEPPDPNTMPMVDYGPGEARLAAYNEADLMRLRDRLTGSERQKLEDHMAAMGLITGGGSSPMVGSCMPSDASLPGADGRLDTYTDIERVTRGHAQVIAQAFACNLSTCATLQILNDFPNWFSDLPEVRTGAIIGRYGDSFRFHENLVHDYWSASGQDQANLRVGYLAGLRWSASHFAAVLEELDAVIDPMDPTGGSILDNTVIFWHNEFGHDGHDRQDTRHPAVIAGGGGRTLRLGRYLRLRDINSSDRVRHNRLLTSIAQAMGLTDVDYFGDRDLGDRPEYRGPLVPLMAT